MDFDDDVVDRRRRFRPLRECDPGCFAAGFAATIAFTGSSVSRARTLDAPLRDGQSLGTLVDYALTEPLLVVEVDSDVCSERDRWRYPTQFDPAR